MTGMLGASIPSPNPARWGSLRGHAITPLPASPSPNEFITHQPAYRILFELLSSYLQRFLSRSLSASASASQANPLHERSQTLPIRLLIFLQSTAAALATRGLFGFSQASRF